MKVAVDISLYPLTEDFIPPIDDIIERMSGYDDISVTVNPMSTQVRGEYDAVMAMLNREVKTTFESIPKAVIAMKILNNPIGD